MEEENNDKKIAEIATYIRGSFKWRMAYILFKALMLLESIAWTIMDILRYWRMRVAKRIYKH